MEIATVKTMKRIMSRIKYAALLSACCVIALSGHAEERAKCLSVSSRHDVSSAVMNSVTPGSKPFWMERTHTPACVRIMLSPQSLPVTGANVDAERPPIPVRLPAIRLKDPHLVFPRTSRAPPTA